MPPTNKIKVTGATPEEERELHKLFPHLFDAPPEPEPDPRLEWSLPEQGYLNRVHIFQRNEDAVKDKAAISISPKGGCSGRAPLTAQELLDVAAACIDAAAALVGVDQNMVVGTAGNNYRLAHNAIHLMGDRIK